MLLLYTNDCERTSAQTRSVDVHCTVCLECLRRCLYDIDWSVPDKINNNTTPTLHVAILYLITISHIINCTFLYAYINVYEYWCIERYIRFTHFLSFYIFNVRKTKIWTTKKHISKKKQINWTNTKNMRFTGWHRLYRVLQAVEAIKQIVIFSYVFDDCTVKCDV